MDQGYWLLGPPHCSLGVLHLCLHAQGAAGVSQRLRGRGGRVGGCLRADSLLCIALRVWAQPAASATASTRKALSRCMQLMRQCVAWQRRGSKSDCIRHSQLVAPCGAMGKGSLLAAVLLFSTSGFFLATCAAVSCRRVGQPGRPAASRGRRPLLPQSRATACARHLEPGWWQG